jgi:serine/threonine-protein kinase
LPSGTIIDGKYCVMRTLGQGGMGVVYVAEHTFLKKPVALKLLRGEVATQVGMAARFEQEARATSLIEHENVVRVTDFGRTPAGELYLVMELLDGRPLSAELLEKPKVKPGRALWVTQQVLRGLEAAHGQGVVHRDLKPDNVFVVSRTDGQELVKLVDFGIAKLRSETATHLTITGSVMGTPQYMSPEQARGEPDVDHRADLYAVGVMMYKMLAGQPPYRGENYNLLLFEILSGQPTPLEKVAPDVDKELIQIVMRAMASDRKKRYQNARELRVALEGIMPRILTLDERTEFRVAVSDASSPQNSGSLPTVLTPPPAPLPASKGSAPPRTPPSSPQLPAGASLMPDLSSLDLPVGANKDGLGLDLSASGGKHGLVPSAGGKPRRKSVMALAGQPEDRVVVSKNQPGNPNAKSQPPGSMDKPPETRVTSPAPEAGSGAANASGPLGITVPPVSRGLANFGLAAAPLPVPAYGPVSPTAPVADPPAPASPAAPVQQQGSAGVQSAPVSTTPGAPVGGQVREVTGMAPGHEDPHITLMRGPRGAPMSRPGDASKELPAYLELLKAKQKEAPPPMAEKKLGGLKYAIIGAALVAVGALGFALFPSEKHVAVGNTGPSHVMITLNNLPPNWMLYLDGVRTYLNPMELPTGNTPHEVRVQALGYHPRNIIVVPSQDQTIDGHLEESR